MKLSEILERDGKETKARVTAPLTTCTEIKLYNYIRALEFMIERDTDDIKSRWADTYKNKTWNTAMIEKYILERDQELADILEGK